MSGLPIPIEKLVYRAVRTPQSDIETARLLESLAVAGADVSLIFENHPSLTDRELRATLHAVADLMRELDRAVAPLFSAAAKPHDQQATESMARPAQPTEPAGLAESVRSVGSVGSVRSVGQSQGREKEDAARKGAASRLLWPIPGPHHVMVHIDGCSKGNPGPAGIGVEFLKPDGKPLAEYCEAIGKTTNNVAEYKAMIAALKIAIAQGVERLSVFTDSQLLARQINGQYRVKNPGLKPLFDEVKTLITKLKKFEITDVRREQNTRADELANLALVKPSASGHQQRLF
jgi:ribonuclease HI